MLKYIHAEKVTISIDPTIMMSLATRLLEMFFKYRLTGTLQFGVTGYRVYAI